MAETTTVVPITKRRLIDEGLDALDPAKEATVPILHQPGGGISRVDIAQVIELGKIMAASQDAVPVHCRGNVGVCVRLCFQAVEWQMSPFSVADQSYLVPDKKGNNRLAYMSQIIHAVIEARAPLRNRLHCQYEGEGETLKCKISGTFTNGDVREYESPEVGKIQVKNSPLWTADVRQQLFYYASRAWARKWCPDVLLGTYTREELLAQPSLGREDDQIAEAPGLHARLSGAERRSTEGHDPEAAARELASIAGAGQTIEHSDAPETRRPGPAVAGGAKKAGKGAKAQPKAAKTPSARLPAKAKAAPAAEKVKATDPRALPKAEGGIDVPVPKTVAQYHKYAAHWIALADSNVGLGQRWTNERSLRNDCGLTAEDRAPLEALIAKRRKELADE